MSAWHGGKWYNLILSQVREPLAEEVKENAADSFARELDKRPAAAAAHVLHPATGHA